MLYLVSGRDEFRREEFIGQLKARMQALVNGEHNIVDLSPPIALADLIAACDATPFLCEKRMVIARGALSQAGGLSTGRAKQQGDDSSLPSELPPSPTPALRLRSGQAIGSGQALPLRVGGGNAVSSAPHTSRLGPRASRAAAAQGLQELIDYLCGLPEPTHLVMVEDDDVELQPLALARPDVVRRPYPPLRPDELSGWIGQRARRHGAEMGLEVSRELADLTGPNLRQLDQEIAKLAAAAPVGGSISLPDLHELVSGMAPEVFKLHDGIAEGGLGTALSAAHALVESGSEPMQLFAHATGLIRRLLVTKELARERRMPEAAAFGLSTSRFAQDKLRRQAERFSTGQLIDAYQKLLEMDLAIKSGRIDAELALELIVAELAGLEPGPRFTGHNANEEDMPWPSLR